MAKGKFSHPREEGGREKKKKFSAGFENDETMILPKATENPLDVHDFPKETPDEDRLSMPEVDFQSYDDLNLESTQEEVPEELEDFINQDAHQKYNELFSPIPPKHIPTEEEAIEQAFQQAVEKEQRPSSRNKQPSAFWANHGKKIILSLVGVAAAAALAAGGFFAYRHFSDPYDHLILSGVQIAGVNIGGMDKEQAAQAVSEGIRPVLLEQDMVVSLPDQKITLSPSSTQISLDVEEAVKAAYRFGRSGSSAQKEEEYRHSLTQTHNVDILPYLSVNKNYIKGQLETYAATHDSDFAPSSYALEGEQPPLDFKNYNENNTPQTLLLILGNPGFHLDVNQALQEILTAYGNLDMTPVLKLQTGTQEPEPLDLDKIYKEYHIDPVDSSMNKDNFDVISGTYGYTFDLEKARTKLADAHFGETVRIPMEYVEPEIMDDEVYFQDVLSTAETPHGNNENRNVNLDLACKAINDLILYPGDEFSYNDTLGQRTADKGYKGAPAYSGHKLVDSLGGGICQVSSTLYYSCLQADLEITDRINHGYLPSYIDPGMDATVSWGKPDFKFRNNSNYPIKIKAESTPDKVIVQILGTDDKDYYVKMEYEMSDVPQKDVYQEYDADSGYYDGQIVDQGVVGHYVKSYRCKYSKKTDVLISRELEANSSYLSRDRIIAVVKTPAPTTPPATTPPTVTPAPPQPPQPPQPPEPPAPPVDQQPEPAPDVPDAAPDAVPDGGGEAPAV